VRTFWNVQSGGRRPRGSSRFSRSLMRLRMQRSSFTTSGLVRSSFVQASPAGSHVTVICKECGLWSELCRIFDQNRVPSGYVLSIARRLPAASGIDFLAVLGMRDAEDTEGERERDRDSVPTLQQLFQISPLPSLTR
jgi:hypothetical protein